MQFSTVLLALVATTSAAVLPRTENKGQWFVQMTLGPDIEQLYLYAEFTSDEYDEYHKLRSSCVEAPNAELPVAHRCDRAAGVTVYGSAPLSIHTFIGGGRFRDETTIQVSSAVA
ncbi:hypothetical protein IG631_06376 [Alternaria alternata]|nr:hypothetical protein IG631_06376 [Alternaria alternata]